MSRIRTLKPELLDDESVASLSDGAFRVFVSAIVSADDYGNLRAEPRHLKGSIFWARETTSPKDAQDLRDELSRAGLIQVYRVRGQTYAHIKGWEKHQRIDNRGKPKVPGPEEAEELHGAFAEILREIPRLAASNEGDPQDSRLDLDQDMDHEWDRAIAPRPSAESEVVRVVAQRERGTRLPADWQPSPELLAWCATEGASAAAHAPAFRDYWLSVPGQKGVKLDWDATFRNWVRRAPSFGNRAGQPIAQAKPSPAHRVLPRLVRTGGGES